MEVEEELMGSLIEYAGDDYEESMQPVLKAIIEDAIEEVMDRIYPFGFSSEAVRLKIRDKALTRYKGKIRSIAKYHYDKQGKEGVLSFSENGSSASYENTGTPESYFNSIIPVAKIV